MAEDSWSKYPEAQVRVTTDLKKLLDGLNKDGMIRCDEPTIRLLDDGIFISMFANSGKHPNIGPVSVDVFIPISKKLMPKDPSEKYLSKPEEPNED